MFGEPGRACTEAVRRRQFGRQSQQANTELGRQAEWVETGDCGLRTPFRVNSDAALGANSYVGKSAITCIVAELTVDKGGDLVAKMRHAAPPSDDVRFGVRCSSACRR
jgi:hypothetical protein